MAVQPANNPVAYLNGQYLPLEEARISPMDRGFLFGDGVYEVIPCYNGKLFRLEQHIQRLIRSLDAIQLPSPHSLSEWCDLLDGLVLRNDSGHQSLYVQVTRGAPPLRDHRFPTDCPATVFVLSQTLEDPDARSLDAEAGIRCISTTDIRWDRCDIKAVSLLANVLLRHEARLAGCDEAILVRDGFVMEGSTSNVFIVRQGAILTPPLGPAILGGITRDLIIELANRHGLPLQEVAIPVAQLEQADEVWISSSTRGARPVVMLDGKPVGDGRPGALWRRMAEYYAALRRELMGVGHF
ncbi:MAG TPA: D-amino acid aminotransferase [Dongiaceae bacterium]|nr:D-amino acid aminotransferase [Dongiaceae bacterium]